MKTKKSAQKKPIVWQVARRPSGAEFEDGSQQDVLLWVERASNRVRQMNLLQAGIHTKMALKDSLSAALEKPMPGCVAGCPGEIQVDDEPLLAELAEMVQGMPIQLTLKRRLDSLDKFYQMLVESLEQGTWLCLPGRHSNPPYRDRGAGLGNHRVLRSQALR